MPIRSMEDLRSLQDKYLKAQEREVPKVIVGLGTCGIAAGAKEVLQTLRTEVAAGNLAVEISQTGCIGMCEQEPLLDVQLNGERITYGKVTPELVKKIVAEHLVKGSIIQEAVLARWTRED